MGTIGDAGTGFHPGAAAREGLKATVNRVQVANDGTVQVFYTISDANNIPLDRTGALSVGAVSTSFILAELTNPTGPLGPGEYTPISKRTAAPADGGTAQTMGTTENTGTFAVIAPGQYAYTMVNKLPAGFTASSIFAVGVQASRTYNALKYVANAVYPFDGTGAASTTRRDVVATATCNKCHGLLAIHGGNRREVALCELCHNSGSNDYAGNTVDLSVMVHKIHTSEDLPSVVDGGTYQVCGSRSCADFSNVALPPPNAANNCPFCHVPGAAAQADIWQREPTRKECGACHDRTWFGNPSAVPAGWSGHFAGEQTDDSACQTCHTPAVIQSVHLIGELTPGQPMPAFEIQNVTHAAPGQAPIVTFKVTLDGGTYDILAQKPFYKIAVTYAGPTAPYTDGIDTELNKSIQALLPDGGFSSDAIVTPTGTPGIFTADFSGNASAVIPATADGTWYFGLEGYIRRTPTPRLVPFNPLAAVSVDGSPLNPKRHSVDTALCNNCHFKLGLHGGQRRNAEYCDLCHNTTLTLLGGGVTQALDAKVFIHKIHMGESLTQQPYYLGTNNFGEVRYPNDARNCGACHVAGGNTLPFGENRHPTAPSGLLAQTAACTSCHDTPFAGAHAATMTAAGVEACATCHGPGTAYDVAVVHAPLP